MAAVALKETRSEGEPSIVKLLPRYINRREDYEKS